MRVPSNQFLRILTALLASFFFLGNSMAEEKTTAENTKDSDIVKVLLKTNMGDISLELDKKKAPISVSNFLTYVDEGFYNGTIFHRVIGNFMIQTGGFDQKMNKKNTKPAIKNEASNGLKNLRGTLAMARTGQVDSATSQFFINLNDNSFLDHKVRDYGYAVFGKVTGGMEVVDKIASVKTVTKGFYQNVPAEPVVIVSAKRI